MKTDPGTPTRRDLLRLLGATGASILAPRPRATAAAPATSHPPRCISGETDHFWYRVAPPDIFIDSQRGDRAFGFSPGAISLSEDNARTWPHRLAFPDADRITFSHITRDGDVLFATETRLYLATDRLKTCREIVVKAPDGSDYAPHTPRDPAAPGWYFHSLSGVVSWDVRGSEMIVWGNYCNVLGGATPVNLYYSTDGGHTVKIAYSFGQSPQFRDDGRPSGGKTGAPLGDPCNPIIARHVHSLAYDPGGDAFYACTGDADRDGRHECHWLRGEYDAGADSWRWTVLVSTQSNTRYKCGGINVVGGQVYWISDANGPQPHDRGIFRCAPADIPYPERHTRLFDPGYECANMIIQDGAILAAHYATASPYTAGFIFSPDMGATWAQYDLKELGRRSPIRFHPKNGDGWFRVDLRSGWVTREEVLFLKPKPPARARGVG